MFDMSVVSKIVEAGGLMPSPFERLMIAEGLWDLAKVAAAGFADGAKEGWRETWDEYRRGEFDPHHPFSIQNPPFGKRRFGGSYGPRDYGPELEDENGQGLLDLLNLPDADTTGFGENMKYRTLDYARQFTGLAASVGLGRYRFNRRIIVPSQLPEQQMGHIVPFAVEMEPVGSDGSDLPKITFGCKYDQQGTLVGFWATDKSTRKSVETQRDIPPRRDIPMKHRLATLVTRLRDQILG